MAISRLTMTDEQRKSVAIEYLKAFDNKGVTSSGGSILDLFADDAQVFFPKWGLANGKKQVGQLFTDFSALLREIRHDYASFNFNHDRERRLRVRRDELRRAPRRRLARRRHARRAMVRCLRGS